MEMEFRRKYFKIKLSEGRKLEQIVMDEDFLLVNSEPLTSTEKKKLFINQAIRQVFKTKKAQEKYLLR